MCVLTTAGFLVALAVVLWSANVVVLAGKAGSIGRFAYIATVAVLGAVAYLTTYHYDYFPNENTHFHGWPIPVVIFQRIDADSPWADFVGATTLLGLPMNFIIFMFVPSLVFLGAAHFRTWRSKRMPAT